MRGRDDRVSTRDKFYVAPRVNSVYPNVSHSDLMVSYENLRLSLDTGQLESLLIVRLRRPSCNAEGKDQSDHGQA